MANQYSGYGGNPYGDSTTNATNNDGYGSRYEETANNDYEMQGYGSQQQAAPAAPAPTNTEGLTPLSMADFLRETSTQRSELQSLNSEIDALASLHDRALSSVDGSLSQAAEGAVHGAQQHAALLTEDLARLERDIAVTPQSQAQNKIAQFNALKSALQTAVRRLMVTEQSYQTQYRANIARQYRVANPDATEEEVAEATDRDWSNDGVFQSAIRHARQRNAQSAYNAVRARHIDLQNIEKTIQELAVLFGQLDQLVATQGAVIAAADHKAVEVVDNVESGNHEVDIATKHARKVRRMKWWCFWIVVLIVCALALILGLYFGLRKN